MTKTLKIYEAKLDNRGRVWLNKAMRDQLGLTKGRQIEWIFNNAGECIVRAATEPRT